MLPLSIHMPTPYMIWNDLEHPPQWILVQDDLIYFICIGLGLPQHIGLGLHLPLKGERKKEIVTRIKGLCPLGPQVDSEQVAAGRHVRVQLGQLLWCLGRRQGEYVGQ